MRSRWVVLGPGAARPSIGFGFVWRDVPSPCSLRCARVCMGGLKGRPSRDKFYQGGSAYAIQILSEGDPRGEASHPDGPRGENPRDPGSARGLA